MFSIDQMKYAIACVALLLINSFCNAQTYISVVPSLTNSAGTIAEKANFSIEVGKQWDVFSLGLDIGKTTFGKISGKDTSVYLEIRPNLNVFQQGKFTSTFTPGIGYVFNAKENLVTEVTYGIEYALNDLIHFNVYSGQYFYSGKGSASSVSFFGLSVIKYLSPSNGKPLISKKL